MNDADLNSAEWIAEAPSECRSSDTHCHVLDLADFDTVKFTDASASTTDQTGSITGGLASIIAVTLDSNAGFGELFSSSVDADATVGSLSADGSSFGVNWKQPDVTVLPPPPIVIMP
jgi:hypothetical protein